MRGILLFTILATALVTAAAPAVANHEASDCIPTASEPALALPGGGVFPVGQDEGPSVVRVGAYVYLEANGLDGLQRADDFATDEACGHGGDAHAYYWQEGVAPGAAEHHVGIYGLDDYEPAGSAGPGTGPV